MSPQPQSAVHAFFQRLALLLESVTVTQTERDQSKTCTDAGGNTRLLPSVCWVACIPILSSQPRPLRTGSFRRATTMPSRLVSARSGSVHRHQVPTPAVPSETQSSQTEVLAHILKSANSTVVRARFISREPHAPCFIDLRTRYAHRVCPMSNPCILAAPSERL